MKLIRYATVFLKRKTMSEKQLKFRDGDVSVDVRDVGHGDGVARLLVQAATMLGSLPEVSPNGEVTVPDQSRKAAEAAIEAVANILAVLNHSARRISSPQPFVALLLESDEEARWSSGLSRFAGQQSSIPTTFFDLPPSTEHLTALSDRPDGVALLAEALAHDHVTGKFHEFMRLFERAFALPPSQCEKKLAQLLEGANLGYDRSEVRRWIDLRNPATHANDLTQPHIVLESHVRPVIARIEQAAYDVLMNKKTWADPSRERRVMWRPKVATASAKNDLMLTKGEAASYVMQVLDPFEAFYYDAGFRLPKLPSNIWANWPETDSLFAGALRVREQHSGVV
jgi:hypothetical protein